MTNTSSDLLRALASGVRGVTPDAPVRQASGDRLIEGQTFDQLLRQAGAMSSGAPVRVDGSTGLKLSPAQMTRLATAADQAEAQGAARALVLMDGMALTMDVGVRTVTGKVDPSASRVMTDMDTVINVPPEGGQASGGATGILPAARLPLVPPGVLRALEGPGSTPAGE